MLNSDFFIKLGELVEIYNQYIDYNQDNTPISIDAELKALMDKLSEYLNRYK